MRPPVGAFPVDFQAIFNAAPGNYLLLSSDLTIIGVTDAYLAATMTARDQIIGRPLFEVFPDNPDDPTADGVRNLRASLERVLMHKGPDRMPVQKYDIRRPLQDGGGFEERFWSPVNCPVLGREGEVRCIIHCVEDVTDFMGLKRQMQEEQDILHEELRSRAQKLEAEVFLRVEAVEASRQLAESERRYRFLVDAVPQLLWTAKADGSADFYNARWFEYTHLPREQLTQDGWQQTVHPEDGERTLAAWAQAIRSGADRFQIEHRIRRHDGTYRWMLTTALAYRDTHGEVLEWLGTTTDIQDRVTAEERLLQAERLQAVGKLAGGVAHEVNNMMTVVIGCATFALKALGPHHEQKSEFGEIIRAASRASDVTRQLLAYSRQQVLRPTVLDLSGVVNELTPALKRLIGSDRELAVTHPPQGARVKADRGQIEQVLINLVANARDATDADGLIGIKIDVVQLDQDALASYQEGDSFPGEYVRIAVHDNGVGMSAELVARVFEPFFTTKAVGEGTGLGLSMVYGIIKQSGGFVKIDSKLGNGTSVAMHLPLVNEHLTTVPIAPSTAPGAGELILVVEDEPQVRAIIRRALQSHGYAVHETPTGAAALAFLSKHPGEVSLVLTDIVMPHVNGRELAHRLREEHPDVPVLFMSGYGGDDIRKRGLILTGSPFLPKPFTPEALWAQVSKLAKTKGVRPRAAADAAH